ncbi:MAG: mechanosensitive ion channel [Candidatus Margulisbacteria bacterium]|nr:mechanosensitive ion channel [Candidatus Margulisiibacteriota bacterium]
MDEMLIINLIKTIGVLIVAAITSVGLKMNAKKFQEKNKLNKSRYFIIRRIINYVILTLAFVALVYIWGVNIKNFWVAITGVLAMIAVAFVAVWSLIGNILAGIILYFTSPFRVNDTIQIMPDDIKGKVIAINTFFTCLVDENGDYINIPNSLFFQKYIKKIRKQK